MGEIPLGGRILVRSKTDWRTAVVSRIAEGQITLSISSPRGRNYRLRRTEEAIVIRFGQLAILKYEQPEDWRQKFSPYDRRW